MSNVVELKPRENVPSDLMSIPELQIAHGYTYAYLYKWSVGAKKKGLKGIEPHFRRGTWVLSESEVLRFDEDRGNRKWQA
jgi:hypothetical protein